MRAEVDTSKNKKQNPSMAMMTVQAITAQQAGTQLRQLSEATTDAQAGDTDERFGEDNESQEADVDGRDQ